MGSSQVNGFFLPSSFTHSLALLSLSYFFALYVFRGFKGLSVCVWAITFQPDNFSLSPSSLTHTHLPSISTVFVSRLCICHRWSSRHVFTQTNPPRLILPPFDSFVFQPFSSLLVSLTFSTNLSLLWLHPREPPLRDVLFVPISLHKCDPHLIIIISRWQTCTHTESLPLSISYTHTQARKYIKISGVIKKNCYV